MNRSLQTATLVGTAAFACIAILSFVVHHFQITLPAPTTAVVSAYRAFFHLLAEAVFGAGSPVDAQQCDVFFCALFGLMTNALAMDRDQPRYAELPLSFRVARRLGGCAYIAVVSAVTAILFASAPFLAAGVLFLIAAGPVMGLLVARFSPGRPVVALEYRSLVLAWCAVASVVAAGIIGAGPQI